MGCASHPVRGLRVSAATSMFSSPTASAPTSTTRFTPTPRAEGRRGSCRAPRVYPEIKVLGPWVTPLQARRGQTKTLLALPQLLLALATCYNAPILPKLIGEPWDSSPFQVSSIHWDLVSNKCLTIITVSSVIWANPHVSCHAPRPPQCASAAPAGWRQLPACRPPSPIEVVAAHVNQPAAEDDLLIFQFIWVSYVTGWLPVEGPSLHGYLVLSGLPGASRSARHLFLLVQPSEFFYTEVQLWLQAEASATPVVRLRPTRFSLRRGFLFHDQASNSRTAHVFQVTGLWRSFVSVMRYVKHSRLARQDVLPLLTLRDVITGYRGAASAFTELRWKRWLLVVSRASQSFWTSSAATAVWPKPCEGEAMRPSP